MAFEELGRKVKQVKPRFSEATILRNINELARDGMLVASSAHERIARWNRCVYVSSDSPAAGERVLSGLIQEHFSMSRFGFSRFGFGPLVPFDAFRRRRRVRQRR